jgi:hypothetical protein
MTSQGTPHAHAQQPMSTLYNAARRRTIWFSAARQGKPCEILEYRQSTAVLCLLKIYTKSLLFYDNIGGRSVLIQR